MLLGASRLRLLHLCLAIMEAAWFTPFLLLFLPLTGSWAPIPAFAVILLLLLAWRLVVELLARWQVATGPYLLIVVAMILVSSLLLMRVFLFSGSGDWLSRAFDALFNFSGDLVPVAALLLGNIFLWQRAASATSRTLSFFSVGVSFRLGMLFLVLGGALLYHWRPANPVPLVWFYFGAGLIAVSVARVEEKVSRAQSTGIPLPPRRLAQLLFVVGLAVGLGAAASLFYTAGTLRAIALWLNPLWEQIRVLLFALLRLVFWLLTPVLLALENALRTLMAGRSLEGLVTALEQITGWQDAAGEGDPFLVLPPWLLAGLRYAAVGVVIILLVGFVLLYLERVRSRAAGDQEEQVYPDNMRWGRGLLAQGLAGLRGLAGLARRYGVNQRLLAAISVQNIYANLCRIARRRGYGRRPSQPPDDYLPVLNRAFEGEREALARITALYMQVHYGDRPVSMADMMQVQRDYLRLRRHDRRRTRRRGVKQ